MIRTKPFFSQLSVFTILLLLLTACSKEAEKEVGEAYDAMASDAENMVSTAGDRLVNTWSDFAEYSVGRKEDFVDGVEEAYAEMKERIESSRELANKAPEEAKESFLHAGEDLSASLDRARAATEEGWEAAKLSVKAAWDDVAEAYRELQRGSE